MSLKLEGILPKSLVFVLSIVLVSVTSLSGSNIPSSNSATNVYAIGNNVSSSDTSTNATDTSGNVSSLTSGGPTLKLIKPRPFDNATGPIKVGGENGKIESACMANNGAFCSCTGRHNTCVATRTECWCQ